MANQINSGRNLGLNQMIIGFIYESLGEYVDLLKAYKVGTSMLFAGPFWLF